MFVAGVGTAQSVQRSPKARPWIDRSALLGLALVTPAFVLMLGLILAPAAQSIVRTLFPPGSTTPSLAGYAAFFADPQSVSNLIFTLEVTLATLAILLAIGLVLALYLRFSQSRLVASIQVLALFPLFVPGIIISFALIRFLGPTGLVPILLKAVGITSYQTPYLHPSGAVIGLVWENMPLTVMLLTAGLTGVSNSAIEAARDVGAGPRHIFIHIVLPQIARSVVVAASLDFLAIVGSFTVPYILGPAAPQMMSIFMQRTFSELSRATAAETQSAVTFLICLAVGAVYTTVVFRDSARRGALAR
jgi:putative spermidine/putrescine transport system permease protein